MQNSIPHSDTHSLGYSDSTEKSVTQATTYEPFRSPGSSLFSPNKSLGHPSLLGTNDYARSPERPALANLQPSQDPSREEGFIPVDALRGRIASGSSLNAEIGPSSSLPLSGRKIVKVKTDSLTPEGSQHSGCSKKRRPVSPAKSSRRSVGNLEGNELERPRAKKRGSLDGVDSLNSSDWSTLDSSPSQECLDDRKTFNFKSDRALPADPFEKQDPSLVRSAPSRSHKAAAPLLHSVGGNWTEEPKLLDNVTLTAYNSFDRVRVQSCISSGSGTWVFRVRDITKEVRLASRTGTFEYQFSALKAAFVAHGFFDFTELLVQEIDVLRRICTIESRLFPEGRRRLPGHEFCLVDHMDLMDWRIPFSNITPPTLRGVKMPLYQGDLMDLLIDRLEKPEELSSRGGLVMDLCEIQSLIADMTVALLTIHMRYDHNDVKAENIFMRSSRGVTRYILGDYGFTTRKNEPFSLCDGIPQTLPYRSPELAHNMKVFERAPIPRDKSDIWALGIVCYIAVCGSNPMMVQDPEELKMVFEEYGYERTPGYSDSAKRGEVTLSPDSSSEYKSLIADLEVKLDSYLERMSAEDKEAKGQLKDQFLSFMRGMLDMNPHSRLSAAQAFNHPLVRDLIRSRLSIETYTLLGSVAAAQTQVHSLESESVLGSSRS